MKKLILIGAMIFSTSAFAARGEDALTGLLGFSQTAVNFGVNYEHGLNSTMGIGGYFFFSGEKKENAGKNQTMSFGAMAPAHILDDSNLNIYIAPGFGITMVKGISPQSDETVFGPSIKTGMLFKITSKVEAGVEHQYFTNWFNDKAQAYVEYTAAALRFGF